jgi:signal transduction histidine kinase
VVQDGSNGEIMVGGILSDITDKKIADQELLEAKRSAEESSRLKSALLQNISHEFRTPMKGILGFSEILMGQIADPECSSMIRHIATSGQRLHRTLDAIMFFAQLEAGEIISKVSQEFFGMAKQKGLAFNVENHQPLFLETDQKLFEVSVRNITENAIKFTEKGRVEITGNIQGNNPPNIVITVSDTGIGIVREKQGLVFEEFRQANEGDSRPCEGSDLGLSITKKCITVINGTLALQSEPGSGTIVTISLPVKGSVHNVTTDRKTM